MTTRSYGYKYPDKFLSAAEIAKLMRADIKEAVKFGLLPGAPVKYSVRVHNYAGGRSINIDVRGWTDAWVDCEGWVWREGRREHCHNVWCKAAGEHKDLPGAEVHQVLSEEASVAQMTLQRIHDAYNHDGSDSMTDFFDVSYYGQVNFETARQAEFREQEAAKRAARRKATDELAAATDTRRVVVYGSKGKRTVHDAVEVDGRVRLVCGATLWRHSVVGKADGQDLTCTRCTKRAAR